MRELTGLLNKVLKSETPAQILSQLDQQLLEIKNGQMDYEKCEELFDILNNSTSLYQIFKGTSKTM